MQNSKAAVYIIHGMIYLISMGGKEIPDYFEKQTIKPENEMTFCTLTGRYGIRNDFKACWDEVINKSELILILSNGRNYFILTLGK